MLPDLEFFKERCVVSPSGCWEWQRYRKPVPDNYGRLSVNGRLQYAHRLAFLASGGIIPTDHWVLHECDNPPCCNPEHLFTGTRLDNNRDMMSKGRNRQPKGSAHAHALFSLEQLEAIRRDPRPGAQIARELDCNKSTICRLKRGTTYKE